MGARHAPIALLAALVTALTLAAPASAATPLFCKPTGKPCTRITVPLDRSGVVPGVLNLQVERRKARRPTRPPLILLAGGPGQSATSAYSVEALTAILGPEARARDVYLLDQRGTGRSNAIACTKLQDTGSPREVAGCASALGARRGLFQTRDSVEDIEAVRRALGLPKIALVGTSYGTRVAEAYAIAHPDRTDRVVLNSVVPQSGDSLLGLDTLSSSPRLLRDFCAKRCASFTPDAVRDFRRLSARLAKRPLAGKVISSRGDAENIALTLADLVALYVSGDLDPLLRAPLPGAVRAAVSGDAAPLLRLAFADLDDDDFSRPSLFDQSDGTFVATICEETPLPWPATATTPAARAAAIRRTVGALPARTFGVFPRAAALRAGPSDLCARWPLSGRPAEAPLPSRLPAVPTLMLAGGRDARTPVENATALASRIPGARVVVTPTAGHDLLDPKGNPCAVAATRRFLAGLSTPARCPAGTEPKLVPPPPASIRRVKPLRGVRGRAGRTAAATRFTLSQAGFEIGVKGARLLNGSIAELVRAGGVGVGGLRAGSARLKLSNGRLTYRGLSEVPGITVTGSLSGITEGRASGRLRIGGSAAARGTLTVRREVARGTLGGRPVRFRLKPGFDEGVEATTATAGFARFAARARR